MTEGLPGDIQGLPGDGAIAALHAHTTPDPTDPELPPPQPSPDPDDVPAPARAPVEEPRAPQPPIKAV